MRATGRLGTTSTSARRVKRGVAAAALALAVALAGAAVAEDAAVVARGVRSFRQLNNWLLDHGAHRVEDLSDVDLLATIRLPQPTSWARRLNSLARVEAGWRGLTNDAVPLQAPPRAHGRAAMQASAQDLEILARIVTGESWVNMPYEGRVAIASVVLNRVVARGYPKTIAGVAFQPYQFSCYNEDVRDRLYWQAVPQVSFRAAREALAGVDPVDGAISYFNPYIVQPTWAKMMKFVRRVGDTAFNTHDFYR